MIPMADNLNHADVYMTSEIFSTSLHKAADTNSAYYTKNKFMDDFSIITR